MEQHVSFDPSSEPAHWFILDIAIARQRAVPLFGPPAAEVLPLVPRSWLLAFLKQSLAWHAQHESLTHYSVLNACRSWVFAEEDRWVSKAVGGAWARARMNDPALIDSALAIRRGVAHTRDLDAQDVRTFVDRVAARISAIADYESRHPVSLSTEAR